MKKVLALLVFSTLSALPALAQGTPVVQVGGGYTFRSLDVPFSSRLDMHGWNATAEYNVNRWLAVAGDFDGTYKSQTDPVPTALGEDKTRVYTFVFGPRIYPLGHHRLSPFVHAMFGFGHGQVDLPALAGPPAVDSSSLSENDFAFTVGGGLDVSLGRHFAFRIAKFDYEQTRFFQSAAPGTPNQNNFKYSAALLIKLGEK